MMNPDSADTAVGERLKQAREAAGYSLADVSARLKMPAHVVQSLEEGGWEAIGAAVFVRGQLRSYARLLGVELEEGELPHRPATSTPPPLVSHVHVPRYRYVAEHLTRRAVYVVLTAALVVPVWFMRDHLDARPLAVEPLDLPPGAFPQPPAPVERTPMVASLAPLPSRAAPAAAPQGVAPVVVEFQGDSWVQLFSRDGSVLEKGLLRSGDRRELRAAEVARVVIGNTAAARMQRGGDEIDLTPYTRANVARFTLSSDGSLAPIAP